MNLEPGEELAVELPAHDESAGTIESQGAVGLFRWRRHHFGRAMSHPAKQARDSGISRELGQANGKKLIPAPLSNGEKPPPRPSPAGQLVLGDVASVLRSKNAGPYEITFDVMFDDEDLYQAVKEADVLDGKLIESLYTLSPGEVIYWGWFDPAMAFKATIPRKRSSQCVASGNFGENDVHGSQQYIPLLRVPFPEQAAGKLREVLRIRKNPNL